MVHPIRSTAPHLSGFRTAFAPGIPQKFSDLRIPKSLVMDILLRHLHSDGVTSLETTSYILKLPVPVLDSLIPRTAGAAAGDGKRVGWRRLPVCSHGGRARPGAGAFRDQPLRWPGAGFDSRLFSGGEGAGGDGRSRAARAARSVFRSGAFRSACWTSSARPSFRKNRCFCTAHPATEKPVWPSACCACIRTRF